jgi:sugar phosphate isomerase/epimerase
MDRREFLNTSIVAALAARVLGDVTLAGAQAPAAPPPSPPRQLILDAYTRHFQWIRDPDALAEAAIEITCTGVNPTIQSYPGHIDPTKVTTQLPAFVKTMQKHGLRVKQVRGGNQTDVAAPNLEPMVATMGQLGVTHYWVGTDNYDLTKPILPQLDAIKKKVEGFVRLNEKHGTTHMYHTRAGANSVGSVVWDLLYVLKDFDPNYVGLHWDTGHMSHHGSNMWELLLRTAGPHVVGVSWKDRSWEQDLGLLGEGGAYPGPVNAAPAGRAGGPPGGGEEFGGAPGGGRGRGGRGSGPREFPLPLAGKTFARGGGWNSPSVPMGTGLVDIFRYAIALRDIGFNGPMELEAEYPLGGAQSGADTITLPRLQVLGALKRDVLTIRAALQQSGSGLVI